MKRSSCPGLLFVMKRSFRSYGSMFVVVLAFAVDAIAATPVDIYQDMDSGNEGELLTPAIMNTSSHGGGSKWSINGSLWVSTANARKLPGPVVVGGVTYAGAGGTRSWMFNDNNQLNYVKCTLPGRYSKITVAGYYATGVTIPWVQFDSINFLEATEGTWGVLQVETEDKGGPYLRCHSASAGSKTTYSPTHVKVTVGKPYWVNLHFDGNAGTVSGAAFDPINGFAQVGTTMVAQSTAGAKIYGSIRFGRTAAHGNHPDAKSQSYFDHILVDYTNGAFPLIPRAIATTPPSAPIQASFTRETLPATPISGKKVRVEPFPHFRVAGSPKRRPLRLDFPLWKKGTTVQILNELLSELTSPTGQLTSPRSRAFRIPMHFARAGTTASPDP